MIYKIVQSCSRVDMRTGNWILLTDTLLSDDEKNQFKVTVNFIKEVSLLIIYGIVFIIIKKTCYQNVR